MCGTRTRDALEDRPCPSAVKLALPHQGLRTARAQLPLRRGLPLSPPRLPVPGQRAGELPDVRRETPSMAEEEFFELHSVPDLPTTAQRVSSTTLDSQQMFLRLGYQRKR